MRSDRRAALFCVFVAVVALATVFAMRKVMN
jgi:hypothetical protein